MNFFLLCGLCLLGSWVAVTEGVTVQDGQLSFPLEAVKKLRDLPPVPQARLVSLRQKLAPRLRESTVSKVCRNPNFPEELKPVCKEPNADQILQRLEAIAEDVGTCEICAYAACTGC
ncbi:guanylin [Ochotona princeps]|uniref:guanylin n=1 Tax=Ochotona princeps TaxID=9978 RepID=UPI00017790B9|nr:guanylin [Ochotona princeps]